MPSQDDVARFSVYLGIPTQEFRTIQGHLATLVGGLLHLAYLRRDRSRLSPEFKPFIEGASTYASVFGYWASEDVRIDDHSEVIEFLVRPENSAPTELLIISEVVFPALFLARQKEILFLIEDGPGGSKRLKLGQLYDPSTTSRESLGRPRRDPQPIDPLRWLRILLRLLTNGRLQPDLCEQLRETEGPGHLLVLERAFRDWKKQHSIKAWSSQTHTDPNPAAQTGMAGEIQLPTIYIRLLIDASCWWIFFGASKGLRFRYGDNRTFLWSRSQAEGLINELRRILSKLTRQWVGGPRSYRSLSQGGPESDDPLANATLWLAFVHDYVVFCYFHAGLSGESSSSTAQDDDDSGLAVKQQDLINTSPAATLIESYQFDKLTKSLFAGRQPLTPATVDDKAYWLDRLGVLAKINDRHFPDTPFIHSWRLLFRFISSPCVDYFVDGSRSPVVWTLEIGPGPKVDWWIETFRQWSDSSTIARMWLSPLVLDAVERANSDMGPLQPAAANLAVDLSVLKRMERQAIAAFPVKIEGSPGSSAREVRLGELQRTL